MKHLHSFALPELYNLTSVTVMFPLVVLTRQIIRMGLLLNMLKPNGRFCLSL